MSPRPLSPLKIVIASVVALAGALVVLNFTRTKATTPEAPVPAAAAPAAAAGPSTSGPVLAGRATPSLPATPGSPGSGSGSGSGSAASVATAPPAPALPAATGPYVSPVARYASEARDESWAPGAEAELRARLTTAASAITCHATTCQLQLSPTSRDDLQTVIARLESRAGLIGVAQEMVLGAVQPAPGELVTMTVHTRLR
jgi:hypothetical protein